ncbi:beta-eliminating lyase-related protein [Streptomyces sp. H27-D2]|nr:beta-eliminating lyase-related protein [Streptomyces sp. H27-D2]MEC4016879.1 beta-eliminating lyase-related protein [Streptomyces sp. H27-D2]
MNEQQTGAPQASTPEAGPPEAPVPEVPVPAVGEPATDAPESEAQDADAPEDPRHRRFTALHGSTRILSGGPTGQTIRERLARLTAEAPDAYDLDDWTDIYGDGVVAALEERVAELLGTEDAAFFPTGTMAQQVALRCWAGRTGNATVALHPQSHPEQSERGALSAVSGLRTVHPTAEPRLPTAEEVRDLDEPFGALVLELPLREAGYVLPSWDELTAVVEAARERDAVVHFDGARLWECAPHFERTLPEIAELADSVYVSFYKSLEGISGAALAGPASFVEEARAWRHRYGGQLFQQWPAALAALAGLDRELPRLPGYVAHAKVVSEALRDAFAAAGLPWFRLQPDVPHTHQFQVWLPYPADVLNEAGTRQAEDTRTTLFRRWFDPGPAGPPGLAVTEVTVASSALEWTPEEIAEAVTAFLDRVRAVAGTD